MAKKLKSLNPIIGTGYKTLSTIKDGEDGNIENFPDTLPKIPRLSYKRLGVSGLEIGWEFEDKIYYTYELYGSTTKGFEASEENLIFQGLASSYFYEAKPGEKWYFKARAKNTHGRYTEFSSELVTYTVKLDNLGEYVEGGAIHGALIENATINNAHIKDLHADKITAGVLDADRIGANSITSEKIQANAITTGKLAANIIASNHIQSGTIESGHIKAGTIESDHIKSNSINSNHIQANTIQSEHIQTGAITAGSGIIAEGAIGSAQISSLDAAKIEAGTIDTSKVTIQGANGHLRLKGNRMQVFQGVGNQAKERVSVGDVNGDGTVYGLRVRGADGQTILLDENGVKSEGITDGSITNDKINEDANIDGAKLNINSVINKINTDGTEVIQGTKIEVDGTNLGVKLSEITNKQTEDSEKITQAYSQIEANEKAIKLKVDEQTYTTDKKDMTSKLEKNTSEISAMKGQIALKVEQTDIENAVDELSGTFDQKITDAKAEIKATTDSITSRVSATETDIEKISNASSQNLLYNSDFRIINGSLPDGWSVSDSSKIALDPNSTLLDGIPTFWFNVTGLTENAYKAVYSPFIEAKAGEKFVASAYVIGYNNWSTLDNGGGLEIEYYNDSSRINVASVSINKSNLNWQRLVVKGTAPTGTTKVRIRVHPTKNGQFNMSKPMLQYGETVTGWDRGFDIKNLTTRLATAESKITEDAITNTVKKNFYTKSETDNQITSKGYQTESEVQQTVNGLEVKVKQSGGYNLLKNSSGLGGVAHWLNSANTFEGYTDTNVKEQTSCGKGFRLGNNSTSEKFAHSHRFLLQKGKKYTVSGKYYVGSGNKGIDVFLLTSNTIDATGNNSLHSYDNAYNCVTSGTHTGKWQSFSKTITVGSTTKSAVIRLDNNGSDTNGTMAYSYFADLVVEEGELSSQWTPHPSEIYDGVTTIDKDGVTVTASNVKSKTNMSANGFKITKTDTNEDVFKVNSDGTLYMKGQITVTGGSVPTSNLSGTISSNQLNSSITSDINNAKNNASSALSTANTAKSTADSAKSTATSAQSTANTANSNATNALNTANSVNSTVNSNKDNWSNAYNRVKEWAYGAVTGTTNINGGMIATNTITVNKMAIADFTNYCEMNIDNCSTYGFTKTTDSSASNNHWMKLNSLARDTAIVSKKNYDAYKGNVQGTYRISFEFNSTVKGATTSGGTDSVLRPIGVGLYCKDVTGASKWHIVSCKSFTSGANTSYTGTVTLDSSIVSFGVYVQIDGYAPFTGQLLIRNIKVNKMANGELIVDGAITANKIASGAITATMITSGTLDASKVNVTNLNASNIKSGKLSANYIDATNLSVKGELLSGQINGVGGIKFAQGAVISSYDSHVSGYKGIQISAPSIKLGDKVDIYSPTLISTVTGKSSTSSTSSSWTMSNSGGLSCSTINTTGTTTVGGTLNVRNNMINGMNNLQIGRGSINIPIFGANYTYDYIKGGASRIAFADSGPIHFLYNGSKGSFIAGGTVYLPHAGNVNCDHFRLGAGIMATPSSGSFHFLTANGNTSPLYAGVLYSATTLSLKEPMVMSNNSVFDKINSIDVIETKNGLRLHNPISMVDAIDESSEVVKTVYNEEKDEIKTSIDYTSAISTLWKAVQELKQENDELKEIIKSLCPKESDFFKDATDC
ncbi:MAG: hypothetical protein J6A25_07060 [Lachnospiraceae bacterium]|nr:hypothetical protein [Lachnospiraceae bacterium]